MPALKDLVFPKGSAQNMKDLYYVELPGTNVFAAVQLKDAAYENQALLQALKLTKTKPASGTILKLSRNEAIRNGALPLTIEFDVGNNFVSRAQIIGSASMLPSNFFAGILNAKYHGNADIKSVRMGF